MYSATRMDAPTPVESAPPLQYAARPSWHARRRVRLALLVGVLVILAVVGALAWKRYGPRLQKRMQMLSLQRSCLAYVPPTGTVLYAQDGTDTPASQPWKRFLSMKALPAWQTFQERHVEPHGPLQSGGLQSQGTLFVGERRSPADNRRLVAVDLRMSWNNRNWYATVEKRAVVPGTLRTEPRETWGGPPAADLTSTNLVGQREDLFIFDWNRKVKLFAGRPDPADPSHFTIDYELDGRHGTIDGWLRDDDAVDLKLRNPDDGLRR